MALSKVSHGLKAVISKDQLTSYWELVKIVERYGIPECESLEYAKRAWNDHEVYRKSPPVPGAKSLLKILHELAIPHVFISSRPPNFLYTTREWFAESMPWVDPETVILGRKEGISGAEFKAAVVNKLNIRLHIEDTMEEALGVAEATPAKVLIVPQPWNLNEATNNPNIKILGPYSETSGVWPVLRFLSSKEAAFFLQE